MPTKGVTPPGKLLKGVSQKGHGGGSKYSQEAATSNPKSYPGNGKASKGGAKE